MMLSSDNTVRVNQGSLAPGDFVPFAPGEDLKLTPVMAFLSSRTSHYTSRIFIRDNGIPLQAAS